MGPADKTLAIYKSLNKQTDRHRDRKWKKNTFFYLKGGGGGLVSSVGRASRFWIWGSRVWFPAFVLQVLSFGKIIYLHFLTLPRCKWIPVLLGKFPVTDCCPSCLGDCVSHIAVYQMSQKSEIGSNLMARKRQPFYFTCFSLSLSAFPFNLWG